MTRFESEESVERYKNFLSQWQEVIGRYYLEHKQGIIQARKHYTWVDSRDSLEVKIQRALVENHGGVTVDVFEDVEYWGFGVKTISRHNDQGAVLLATKIAFSYLRSGKLREAAAELDGLPYVGPSRATKLLALSNQNIYGVYDARASNALRKVNDLAKEIIIPVLPGRTIEGTGGNHALGFENFTWALRFMLDRFTSEYTECRGWRVADIEMGLFILGRRGALAR